MDFITTKLLIGWKEWCALPDLSIPAIKAKIDTGAKTSCLHALEIKPYTRAHTQWVHFILDPLQQDQTVLIENHAPIVDTRFITSSNGHKELRYIIHTTLQLGQAKWPIEISLSNRKSMRFRLLLGRDALKGHAIIDPIKMHCHGKLTRRKAKKLYGTAL